MNNKIFNNKNINEIINTGRNIKNMNKPKFEVNPLDINIAKMQFNLQNRLEKEVPDYGDFAPVVEKYNSKDPTKNFSEVKVLCKHLKEDKTNKQRALELNVTDKKTLDEYSYTLAKGQKNDIIDAIHDNKFFEVCKNVINQIDEKIK